MFEWNDAFSVNVPAMDNQHKRLVNMVNQLYSAMQSGKGDLMVRQVLEQLVMYTKTHFAAEEDLMRKVGFPGLQTHQAEHRDMTDKAQQMINSLKAGKMVATVSLASFLKEWLINHIQKEDRQYGVHIQNHQCVCR